MPTTTDKPAIKVGDKLRVTSTDGGHGFPVGAVGRVIEYPRNYVGFYLTTTRDDDSPVWVPGICAYVGAECSEPVVEDVMPKPVKPVIELGDKLRVVSADGSHGFPVGTVGRVIQAPHHLTDEEFLITTRSGDSWEWCSGVCAYVNLRHVEVVVKDVTTEPVKPTVPVKGDRYRILADHNASLFRIGSVVRVTGNYFGGDVMEVTDMLDLDAAATRGWSSSRTPGYIVRNVYLRDVEKVEAVEPLVDRDQDADLYAELKGEFADPFQQTKVRDAEKVEAVEPLNSEPGFTCSAERTDPLTEWPTHEPIKYVMEDAAYAKLTLAATAMTASLEALTQKFLDFQTKVGDVVLDQLADGALDDETADRMLEMLSLPSRLPVGFPQTQHSVVALTDGNIAIRIADDYEPWKVICPTTGERRFPWRSDRQIARLFKAVIHTAGCA